MEVEEQNQPASPIGDPHGSPSSSSVRADESFAERATTIGRVSLSQPLMTERMPTSSLSKTRSESIVSGATKSDKMVPVIETFQQNEELNEMLFRLRIERSEDKERIQQLTEMLQKPQQQIVDEFFRLRAMAHKHQVLQTKYEELEKQYDDLQKKPEDPRLEEMRRRIAQLEEKLAEAAFEENDEEWTLASDGEPDVPMQRCREDRMVDEIMEMRKDLAAKEQTIMTLEGRIRELEVSISEKDNAIASVSRKLEEQMAKTFNVGQLSNEDSLKRIDELEKQCLAFQKQAERSGKMMAHFYNKACALRELLANLNVPEDVIAKASEAMLSNSRNPEALENVSGVLAFLKESQIKNRVLRNACRGIDGRETPLDDTSATEVEGNASLPAAGFDDSVHDITSADNDALDMVRKMKAMDAHLVNAGLYDSILKLGADGKTNDATIAKNDWTDMENVMDLSGSRPAFISAHPGANLNASVSAALEYSITTSRHMNAFQLNLRDVRKQVKDMFETLKSSASLFGEIMNALDDTSPTAQQLIQKIKDMHFIWLNAAKDADVVDNVMADAETSMVKLQEHLTSLHDSLMMTSFCFDVSAVGRMSFAQTTNNSPAYVPIQQSFIHKEEEAAAANKELQLRLDTVTEELEEVRRARDKSIQTVETLRKSMFEMETRMSTHQNEVQDKEDLIKELKLHIDSAEKKFEEAKTNSSNLQLEVKDLQVRVEELERDCRSLTSTRDELADRCVDIQHQAEELKSEVQKGLEEKRRLQQEYNSALSSMGQLENEIANAKSLNESIQKQWMVKEAHLNEQLQVTKSVCDEISRKYADLQNKWEERERARATEVHRKVREEAEPSTFARSRNVCNRDSQTPPDKVEEQLIAVIKELDKTRDIFTKFRSGVRNFVGRDRETKNKPLDVVGSECDELIGDLKRVSELDRRNEQEIKALKQLMSSKTSSTSTATVEWSRTNVEPNRYSSKLRQSFYKFTCQAKDLVDNLRKIEPANANMKVLIDDARTLRNGVNELFVLFKEVDKDKENCQFKSPDELAYLLKLADNQNSDLRNAVYQAEKELQTIRKSVPLHDVNLKAKIEHEIQSIHRVMSAVQRVAGGTSSPANVQK